MNWVMLANRHNCPVCSERYVERQTYRGADVQESFKCKNGHTWTARHELHWPKANTERRA